MKKTKKSAANFQQLDATQMGNIKGGVWIKVPKPDGTITYIWV